MTTILWNTDMSLCGMFFFAIASWMALLRMFYLWYSGEFSQKGEKHGKHLLKLKSVTELLLVLFFSLCLSSCMQCRDLEIGPVEKTLLIWVMPAAEGILYDPNSPLRNETLYMEVLRNMLVWQRLDKDKRVLLKDARFEEIISCIKKEILPIGEKQYMTCFEN